MSSFFDQSTDQSRVKAASRGTVAEAGIVTEVETVLVLTRTTSERITIGDNITVMVVEIRGDKVRLGIEAPAEVPVVRDDAITRTKKRGRKHPAERTAT